MELATTLALTISLKIRLVCRRTSVKIAIREKDAMPSPTIIRWFSYVRKLSKLQELHGYITLVIHLVVWPLPIPHAEMQGGVFPISIVKDYCHDPSLIFNKTERTRCSRTGAHNRYGWLQSLPSLPIMRSCLGVTVQPSLCKCSRVPSTVQSYVLSLPLFSNSHTYIFSSIQSVNMVRYLVSQKWWPRYTPVDPLPVVLPWQRSFFSTRMEYSMMPRKLWWTFCDNLMC